MARQSATGKEEQRRIIATKSPFILCSFFLKRETEASVVVALTGASSWFEGPSSKGWPCHRGREYSNNSQLLLIMAIISCSPMEKESSCCFLVCLLCLVSCCCSCICHWYTDRRVNCGQQDAVATAVYSLNIWKKRWKRQRE